MKPLSVYLEPFYILVVFFVRYVFAFVPKGFRCLLKKGLLVKLLLIVVSEVIKTMDVVVTP
jgi:hypothetical protein